MRWDWSKLDTWLGLLEIVIQLVLIGALSAASQGSFTFCKDWLVLLRIYGADGYICIQQVWASLLQSRCIASQVNFWRGSLIQNVLVPRILVSLIKFNLNVLIQKTILDRLFSNHFLDLSLFSDLLCNHLSGHVRIYRTVVHHIVLVLHNHRVCLVDIVLLPFIKVFIQVRYLLLRQLKSFAHFFSFLYSGVLDGEQTT